MSKFSLFNGHVTHSQTVIAGLTRNLPSEKVSSLRLGDGGCPSAMTVKGIRVVTPCHEVKRNCSLILNSYLP